MSFILCDLGCSREKCLIFLGYGRNRTINFECNLTAVIGSLKMMGKVLDERAEDLNKMLVSRQQELDRNR